MNTPRILDLSSYAVLAIMGGLGIAGLDARPEQATAAVLCLCFGVLYAWTATRARTLTALTLVHLVQTAIVAAAILLGSEAYEAFGFLLMLLAVHISSMVRPGIAVLWVLGFWVVHGVTTAGFLHGPESWIVVVFNLGIYLVCGVVGHVLRELAGSEADLQRALTQLRLAQDHIRSLAVDEERGRLARDLHDGVKQNLFAAGMQIGTARALLPEDTDGATTALHEGDELIQRAGADLGLVIHELRPVELEEVGLTAALRDYVRGWSRQSGIEARFDAVGSEAHGASPEIGHALLRVTQEALANISRHSGAEHVDVRLSQGAPIHLTVLDDGAGFSPGTKDSGFGLHSMRSRIEDLGGTLSVRSTPGRGTTVTAEAGRP